MKKRPSSSRLPTQLSQQQDVDQQKPVYKSANHGAKEEIKASKQNTTQFNKSLHANTLSMPNQNLKLAAEKKNPNSMSKDKVLPQLEKLVPKSDGSRKPKESSITNQVPHQGVCKLINPASCVINKPTQGPILVLRPTEDALKQALISHLAVQDEMDKQGYSSLYTPIVEKSQFVHNAFERKSLAEIEKQFGSGSKQTEIIQPSVNVASSDQAKASGEPEAVIDLQAEMRAARLKMQQQYEDALKKKQQTANE